MNYRLLGKEGIIKRSNYFFCHKNPGKKCCELSIK